MGPMAPKEGKRKVLVIDANVLLHDPRCLRKFGDNIVVIPIWVIEELDKCKKWQDETGVHAREISRQIEKVGTRGSLTDGAPTDTGGLLFVDYNGTDFSKLPVGLERTVDNRIILIAKAWQERREERLSGKRSKSKKTLAPLVYADVIIVTKDTNLRIKAAACGIKCQDYLSDKLISNIDLLYSGIATHALPEYAERILHDYAHHHVGAISASLLADALDIEHINANQCCRLQAGDMTTDTIYKKSAGHFRIVRKTRAGDTFGKNSAVAPINAEQSLAYDLLTDPTISLVTLNGKAGSGKTLMALLAGHGQLGVSYEQLIIYRPNIEIGKPMGFLPGGIDEKFAEFMLPIFDNMKLIVDAKHRKITHKIHDPKPPQVSASDKVDDLIKRGLLTIGPINFIRGRSITNAFVIIDEAQNLTPLEAKTMITRAGSGTKFVLTGDVHQIDNPLVDSISNGLSHTIERLKDSEICGHITLPKCERSDLAELAALNL